MDKKCKNRDIQKYFELLKDKRLFKDISKSILYEIFKDCKYEKIQKGEDIDSQETLKELYIILNGRVKVSQTDIYSSRSLTLFILERGDIFDVFTLLEKKEHIALFIALDDVEVLKIPLNRAKEYLNKYPQFNKNFYPYLGDMLRYLEEFSQDLVFSDVPTRLAKLILRYAVPKTDETQKYFGVKLIHNLSHEALAELIGSVRSVVSLQMQKLKEEKIILSKRGHLAIKNLELLISKSKSLEECIYEKLIKKESR